MSTLTYRGYTATIDFDSEDMILTGRIAGINDVIGFHAESPAELVVAFHGAVDDYLETCAKLGKQPEKAYSGKVMFRVPPELHAKVALAAKLSGKSLNQWGEALLERAAG
jgi:predicted HicB family RNase H-like nuclease